MTSTLNMIETYPLSITTMVQYPPLHWPRRPELKEQGGNGGHLTKYHGKSCKPKAGYIRTPTTNACLPSVFWLMRLSENRSRLLTQMLRGWHAADVPLHPSSGPGTFRRVRMGKMPSVGSPYPLLETQSAMGL